MEKKLISTTDYVLEQDKVRPSYKLYETDWAKEFELRFKSVVNYANFLRQPLTLGMFIACDKEGNVLEKPKKYDLWLKGYFVHTQLDKYYQYRKAKERVLFEGFTISENDGSDGRFWTVSKGDVSFQWDSAENEFFMMSGFTIESLVKYNLTLTQTALTLINK